MSVASVEKPVIFPPGRARLATTPLPTACHHNGNRASCVFGGNGRWRTACHDNVYLDTDWLVRKSRHAIGFSSICISILNENIFPLYVAKLAQTLPKRLCAGRESGKGDSS